jgi:hypothetical protein
MQTRMSAQAERYAANLRVVVRKAMSALKTFAWTLVNRVFAAERPMMCAAKAARFA